MIGIGRPRTGRPKSGSYREGRNRKLCIRLSDEDLRKLNHICDIYGITKSDFVIGAIVEEVKFIAKKNMSIQHTT